MKDSFNVQLIDPTHHHPRTLELLQQLNPRMDREYLKSTQAEMVQMPNYHCFGLFNHNKLVGIASAWTTVRIYCGKQIELDNVIIDQHMQSKGLGKYFMNAIKDWSIENNYASVGLNTYVQNSRSHKFYFNEAFKILGFHFEHKLNPEKQ